MGKNIEPAERRKRALELLAAALLRSVRADEHATSNAAPQEKRRRDEESCGFAEAKR